MTENTLERCAPSATACTVSPLRTVVPRADVWETEDGAHLVVELPGVTKDDLDLRIENDRLLVAATPKADEPEGRVRRLEWRPTAFRRAFALTDDADRDAIQAKLRHGLLHVTIPRRAEKRPRRIEVRVDAD
jgi:HSP20 family molecular chaperone IbpA